MTIHYGKRNPGLLTAASPGDTLYIPLQFFNDSGASISIGNTLVAGDIEVFKNGSVTQRATDSGYAVLGDTGNFDNRIGFKGISISLYNTADDASFYAVGSTYWVAIDSVTVDGRTVRFWPAVFEIGENRANIVQVGGDTGAANYLRATFANGFADTGIQDNLGRIRSDVDTGLRVHIDDLDTGLHAHISDVDTGIHSILQTVGVLVSSFSDTGVNNRLDKIQADVDTGLQNSDILRVRGDTGAGQRLFRFLEKLDTGGDLSVPQATVDTGLIAAAIWSYGGRKLLVDTGIADQVWKTATSGYADDTGTFGELLRVPATASVDTGQVNQAVWQANAQRKLTVDTGIADQVWMQTRSSYTADTGTFGEHLGGSLGTAVVDTGVVNQAVWQANAVRGITAIADTGMNERFARIQSDVDTGLRTHIDDSDTGVKDAIADLDTGLRGILITTGVNLGRIRGDTGGADRFYRYTQKLDTGGDATVSASIDTGQVVNAVWNAIAEDHSDTGTFGGNIKVIGQASVGTAFAIAAGLDVNINAIATDTGAASRLQQAFTAGFTDTGINQRLAQIQADVDTGLRAQISDLDTGLHDTLADYDTGIRAILVLQDTGAVASAVWNFATRSITASSDTGINDRLAKILADTDTGIQSSVNLTQIRGDTGAADRLLKLAGSQLKTDGTFDTGTGQTTNTFNIAVTANVDTGQVSNSVWNSLRSAHTGAGSFGESDTGINSRLTAVQAKTDGLTFTVANVVDANIQRVNDILITGTGDTGAADTWRPA